MVAVMPRDSIIPKPITRTIPLVGALTARGNAKSIGTSAKDQQYINCLFEVAESPQIETKNIYAVKRAGSATSNIVLNDPIYVLRNYTTDFGPYLFIANTTDVYATSTKIGTISGGIGGDRYAADSIMNGKTVIVFSASDGTGYYVYYDATTTNFPTFTGDTHTNAVIDGIASTTGIYPGQLLSGTGIQAGTRVTAITSATAITVSPNTTATNAGVTITKEAVAKIATFPSNVVSMEAMDGYAFAGTSDGKIYNSNINDPYTWGTSNYISADFGSDTLIRIFKLGNIITALGVNTSQPFQNTGNSSGSVLSNIKPANKSGVYFAGLSAAGTAVVNPTQILYYSGAAYALIRMGGSGAAFGLARFNSADNFEIIFSEIPGAIALDNTLATLGTARNGDKTSILIHGSSATDVLFYDPTNNTWSVVNMNLAITSSFEGRFTKNSGGAVFNWASDNTWQDSSAAYTMTIQTEPWDGGTQDWKRIQKIELIGDTQSSGTTTLAISSDDYATFTTIGTFDMTSPRMEMYSCGVYQGSIAFKLTHSDNTAWRAQALRITYTVGTA